MNKSLRLLLTTALAGWTCTTLQAQTISNFEEISLPGPDTTFLHSQMPNGNGSYTFQSGLAAFYGEVFYDVYWGGFNCTNHTDNQTYSFGNDASAITGSGFDSSDQYVVSFVSSDFLGPDPTATIPIGVKLIGNAEGHQVAGVYVTNTTYTYNYMTNDDFYANNQFYYHLIIRGYAEGAEVADSVVFPLADFTNGNEIVLSDWTWVYLSILGQIDSMTFDLSSNDVGQFGINTPTYFALDNLVTLDGNCPGVAQLSATEITQDGALITWQNEVDQFTTTFEIAIDQSETLEPIGAVTSINGNTYTSSGLTPNTLHYVHIRSQCDDGSVSAWDTLSFQTEMPSSIGTVEEENFSITINPNPATNFLFINTDYKVHAVIYSIEGKVLSKQEAINKIDISALAPGVYFIKISDKNNKAFHSQRFIKR